VPHTSEKWAHKISRNYGLRFVISVPWSGAGLPDGLLSNPKIPIWVNVWALDWKLSIHFMAIWNSYVTHIWDILWPFGTFCVHLVHLFPLLGIMHRKIWQPWSSGHFVSNSKPKRCRDP
jgi:hypothetical protein